MVHLATKRTSDKIQKHYFSIRGDVIADFCFPKLFI